VLELSTEFSGNAIEPGQLIQRAEALGAKRL